ncbi:MAG: cell division protein FtsB [Betaproteobacteria bacterium RIFCSPLOWO2_02_FULL_65_20]|nr:MAG: cell division protein FtsB [Betaproteobacteria bacterium RIFCSPLOWO2_02_FULL_65_20]
MKVLAAVLVGLVVLLQFALWLGKGGWLRVWDMDRQVQAQKDQNAKAQRRNVALDAEVRDLKQGLEAVEERARYDLGMVKQDEVFFQVVEPAAEPKPAAGAKQAMEKPGKTGKQSR